MKTVISIHPQIITHILIKNTAHQTTIAHTKITIKKITQKNTLNHLTTTIIIRVAIFCHI